MKKTFLVMEIPSTVNQYCLRVWKYHFVDVSVLICFSVSCFNSETECVTHQAGLGPTPDQ